jgi:hypothetical protein
VAATPDRPPPEPVDVVELLVWLAASIVAVLVLMIMFALW